MKKFILILALFVIAGCNYEGEKVKNYIDEPQWFIKDPHYGAYKDKMSALESSYLNKEITYAEYITQKQVLEDKYSQEVQERNKKVAPSAY